MGWGWWGRIVKHRRDCLQKLLGKDFVFWAGKEKKRGVAVGTWDSEEAREALGNLGINWDEGGEHTERETERQRELWIILSCFTDLSRRVRLDGRGLMR